MSAAGPSQGANYSPLGGSAAAEFINEAASVGADTVIAVIGAGAMGSGIAQVAAQAGHPVRLFDARMGAAEAARRKIAVTLESLASKGKLSVDAAREASERIAVIDALGDCASASLVIEAIVEEL